MSNQNHYFLQVIEARYQTCGMEKKLFIVENVSTNDLVKSFWAHKWKSGQVLLDMEGIFHTVEKKKFIYVGLEYFTCETCNPEERVFCQSKTGRAAQKDLEDQVKEYTKTADQFDDIKA